MTKSTDGKASTTRLDYLLECLLSLGATGPNGFEGLIRVLLEKWTNQTFRLARSGSQSGKDTTSENPNGCVIAAEMKRYEEGTSLSRRMLLGELSEVITGLPDLELWVLSTTKEIGDKEAEGIRELSERLDVETLIIDSRSTGIGPIQAFCAKYPDITLNFCIVNGDHIDSEKLSTYLNDIQVHPAYADAADSLKRMLDATLLGRSQTRQDSLRWLTKQVNSRVQSWAVFRQDIALHDGNRVPAIDRTKHNEQFDDWWQNKRTKSPHCILLGEEGTGKTWAIISWLMTRFRENNGPIVLPVTSSQLTSATDLQTLLAGILENRFGKSITFWLRRINHWLEQAASNGPIFLLCLDGLNEKPDFPWKAIISQSVAEAWIGKIAILMTSRPEYWKEHVSYGVSGIQIITTEGYGDEELKIILGRAMLKIEQIPKELYSLIKKPRYCDLVVQHFSEMVASGDLTIDRLLYEDYKDRTARKQNLPVSDAEFNQILCSFAQQHLNGVNGFSKAELIPFLPTTGDRTLIQEIIDGGLLVPTGKQSTPYRVENRRLIYGLGMLLADDLKEIGDKSIDYIADRIQAWLEPQSDMEMKVQITGAAVFFSTIDTTYPQSARRALLRAWIGSRNMSEGQERVIGAYISDCADDLLAITDDFWRSSSEDGLSHERLANVFLKHRDDPKVKPHLIQATKRWMSYVNTNGQLLERGGDNKRLEELNRAILDRLGQEPKVGDTVTFHGRSFPVTDDDGLLRLARFALLIISGGDRLPFIEAFYYWSISRRLMGRHAELEEASWVLQLADEDLWAAFAPTLNEMATSENDTIKKAADLLLTCLGNREALALKEKHLANLYPLPEWWIEHLQDPCKSIFALQRSGFEPCMAREDLDIKHLLWKIDKKYLPDPQLRAPESFIGRIADETLTLPVSGYRTAFGTTSEDCKIEQFETALARFAPSIFGDLMRKIVQSIRQRNEKTRKPLLTILPRLGLILRDPEIAIIRETISTQINTAEEETEKNSFNYGKYAEAEAALALVMHLDPVDVAELILGRPDEAVDLVPLEHWFELLPDQTIVSYLDRLLVEPNETYITRLLWILCESQPSLTDGQRHRIMQLIESGDEILRFSAIRFTWATKDKELIKCILTNSYSLLHPEKSQADNFIAEILCRYGNEFHFDQLSQRLPLSRLGWAIHRRGFQPEEITVYAQCLNSVCNKLVGCKDIVGDRLINAIINLSDDLDVSFKQYQEVPADKTVHFISSALTWGSPPSLSPDDCKRLMTQESAEQFRERQRAFREKIERLTSQDETRWQSDQFNTDVLERICRDYPQMVETWVNGVGENDKALFLCEGFYQSLCAALANEEPSLGFKLWHLIQSRPVLIHFMESRARTDWMTCLPFAARPSEKANMARRDLLDRCYSDIELLKLANAAGAYAREDWIVEEARQLIRSPFLWRRVKGLMLFCLANTEGNIDEMISLSDIHGTWVEERIPTIRYYHSRNIWAKYWYSRFLSIEDNDEAFASYHLFLKCADRRCYLWMDRFEKVGELNHTSIPSRIKFCITNEEQLKRAVEENEKDLKNHFLTVKFDKGQLLPFMTAA
ncbi:MAG: hypothetical protein NT140_03850 [Deltaproteobacteria bacterium]|nr:hypothetical protein [Deltaproteobacteria bacterium]